jgi:hypothetical protein
MGEVEVSIDCSRIDWGSNFYSYRYYYKNDIEIFANGKKIISTNQIDSKPDTSSVSLGNAKTKISLDKNIELRINITTSYGTFWASKMDGGKGTWTGTVSELQASKTIDLVPDDNAFRNKATIVLNGIPMAPSLPDWKDN